MLKSYDNDEANKILNKANIGRVDLNAEEMVALKADMGIPWNESKTMARFNLLKHGGIIKDEIHIKIGGDHGGGSFKMSYQVVNQNQPNSKSNSFVFSTFEAKDYRVNLKVGLSRYTQQVDEMQKMVWKNHHCRVFMFGDYDFLCSVYGITGASGRHCCLFCDITKEEIKITPENRKHNVSHRTLYSLTDNFESFQSFGGVLKNAKLFNNVIDQSLFNIPLDQVAVPALHISLGIFLKFFIMLEDECQLIDIKLAGELALSSKTIDKAEFDKFISMHVQSSLLNSVITDCIEKIALLQDTVGIQVLRNPERAEDILKIYKPRILYYELRKNEKSIELQSLHECNKLDKVSGPCIQKLDEILKENKVERQAYHGKCFVGNHVHKMLKHQPLLDLCNSIPKLVVDLGFIDTGVHLLSIDVSQKFKKLFSYYSKCHNIMNSSHYFKDNDILELDLAIKKLMEFYRFTWPDASITPKMHLLENHVYQFIEKWRLGIGVYGEEGGESLHTELNNLNRLLWHMKGRSRLESTVKEHFLRNHRHIKSN
ncbi:uncharacterized protein LOC136081893 [Hydra vulgaris]|uniref:Uncharacterized protein LOC136081893 n=1 Tax=Hydra vulgaris TaxID=6087 RepID=A0ABM4C439_HYDVU